MAERAYICVNGEFKKSAEPSLFPHNRAFRYGDTLVENIHACATTLQFPGYHLDRLFYNMQLLSMEIPAYFSVSLFSKLAAQLLNKNRIFGGASIRITVYRDAGTAFIPDTNKAAFLIESLALPRDHYALNERGLAVDICSGYVKPTGPLSGIRNAHCLLYLAAGIEGRKKDLDAVILLNETGKIVETADSNIFLVSGNAVFTPGIAQGCVPGVMRRVILELAETAGYRVNDQSNLTPGVMDDAEEVFLTNAIDGMRWVVACRERRYYKRVAKFLNEKLNEKAFGNT